MLKNLKFLLLGAAFILSVAFNSLAQTTRTEPITVGDSAPDFTLQDNSGKKVTLSEAVKNSTVVLVFYRGSWCPFCARQLADLRGLLQANEATVIFAVSIDSTDKSTRLIKKIEKDGKGKINYSLLSDPNAKTIDEYGLRDPRYKDQDISGIPYPTVYVIGSDRKVAWAKLEKDYKQRPTNEEIRAAIDKLRSN